MPIGRFKKVFCDRIAVVVCVVQQTDPSTSESRFRGASIQACKQVCYLYGFQKITGR